jgi:hypothetical protein
MHAKKILEKSEYFKCLKINYKIIAPKNSRGKNEK